MAYIDFAEVKAKASLEEVARWLGLTLTPAGKQFRSPCPACNAGGSRAIVLTPEKGLYFCFSDKKGGDQLALAAHIKGVSQKEAAALIGEHFGLGGTVQNGTSTSNRTSSPTAPPARSTGFDPETYASRLIADHEALAPLDLAPETLKAWKAGYATHGSLRGRLAVRLNTRSGDCVGYFGLALNGEQPQITAPNGVNISEYIFNAEKAGPGTLYVVRGPLEVIQASENGVENAVCLLCTDLTPHSLTMIVGLCDSAGCTSIEFV